METTPSTHSPTPTSTTTLPPTMRAWQWTACPTTLDSALSLNPNAPLPSRPLAPGEALIRVHAASLNPVDYKLAELPLVARFAIAKPATPGLDFAGVVALPGPGSPFKAGDRVFGKLEPRQQHGALGEFVIGSAAGTVGLPAAVSFEAGAALGVCGLVAYQSVVRDVRGGDRVFVNGGSGGVGTFAVQIARAVGGVVVAACSGTNVQLVKDLGADEVIDYRTQDVPDVLARSGKKFDFVLDNVGEPAALYWKAPQFTKPGAKYVQIGSQVSLWSIYDLAYRFVVPTWLRGGQRPFSFAMAKTNLEDYQGLVKLVAGGKVRPVIDEVFGFEDVPLGYKKLRTGRARGKIVVRVVEES